MAEPPMTASKANRKNNFLEYFILSLSDLSLVVV